MPKIRNRIAIVTRSFKDGTQLAESLMFPEFSCVEDHADAAKQAVVRTALRLVESKGPTGVLMRGLTSTPVLRRVAVEIQPPKHSALWRIPLSFDFDAVCWSRGKGHQLALAPALGLTVIEASEEKLEKRLVPEILFALERKGHLKDLQSLGEFEGLREVRVDLESFACDLLTPKQAMRAKGAAPEVKPVLEEVAVLVVGGFKETAVAYEIEELLGPLAELLSAERPSPVLLVGPSGVGKTAAFREIARTGAKRGLSGSRFWMTGGARLNAWSSGFGMLEECCRRLCRELSQTKDVIHLGNLVELAQAGKDCEPPRLGPGELLRPSLAAGEFRAVAECTAEQLSILERDEPHLLQAFTQLEVGEPSVEKGRAILLCGAIAQQDRIHRSIDLGALEELDRLHRRYATYSAYPGRPLRFLENLLRRAPERTEVSPGDVIAAFSQETGLPRFLFDDALSLDPAETAAWFSSRVMGQPLAVDLVTDLIAVVKARLSRPVKPLASMLFIGPTGVGKTEMAKALAEYLFGDKARVTRFDMTEFLDRAAAERLIGGVYGSEGLLTAAVREQPFSLLLFDEFEKAHPLFFDLLLQVLGEARLTDAAGNLADFRNCVVVMTSNLGAETFGGGIAGFAGQDAAPPGAQGHFKDAVRRFLRPELYNRIDSIVPFSPLGPDTLRGVVRRELDLVRNRHGAFSRGLRLEVEEAAQERLVDMGYDPRYGARPLKRAVARELVLPLAEAVNRRAEPPAPGERTEARVGLGEAGLSVEVKALGACAEAAAAHSLSDGAARAWTGFRRKVHPLTRSAAVRELESDAENLKWRLYRLSSKKKAGDPTAAAAKARLEAVEAVLDRVAKLGAAVGASELDSLVALWSGERASSSWKEDLDAAFSQWRSLLETILSLTRENPDLLTMMVVSESPEYLGGLLAAYQKSLDRSRCEVRHPAWLRVGHSKETGKRAVNRVPPRRPERPWEDLPAGAIGALFEVAGPLAALRYGREAGLHLFKDQEKRKDYKCLVDTFDGPAGAYKVPDEAGHKGFVSNQALRRTYVLGKRIEDELLAKPRRWVWSILRSLGDLVDELYEQELERVSQE